MAKGLLFLPAGRTDLRGGSIGPEGIGSEGALLGSHLVQTTGHEFTESYERVRGEGERKAILEVWDEKGGQWSIMSA